MDTYKVLPDRLKRLFFHRFGGNAEERIEEIALQVGATPQYLMALWEGKGKRPSGEMVARLAVILRTSVEYLVGLTDDPRPFPEDSARARVEDVVLDPNRLFDEMRALGMTARELAQKAGLAYSTVDALLAYDAPPPEPRLNTLVRLAQALQCSVAYLVGVSSTPNPPPWLAPSSWDDYEENELHVFAYHEAGHVLAALMTGAKEAWVIIPASLEGIDYLMATLNDSPTTRHPRDAAFRSLMGPAAESIFTGDTEVLIRSGVGDAQRASMAYPRWQEVWPDVLAVAEERSADLTDIANHIVAAIQAIKEGKYPNGVEVHFRKQRGGRLLVQLKERQESLLERLRRRADEEARAWGRGEGPPPPWF